MLICKFKMFNTHQRYYLWSNIPAAETVDQLSHFYVENFCKVSKCLNRSIDYILWLWLPEHCMDLSVSLPVLFAALVPLGYLISTALSLSTTGFIKLSFLLAVKRAREYQWELKCKSLESRVAIFRALKFWVCNNVFYFIIHRENSIVKFWISFVYRNKILERLIEMATQNFAPLWKNTLGNFKLYLYKSQTELLHK